MEKGRGSKEEEILYLQYFCKCTTTPIAFSVEPTKPIFLFTPTETYIREGERFLKIG